VSSKTAIVRQAQELIQRKRSETTAPVVLWAGLDETPKVFAKRVAKVPANGALVLAVVPHGYTVPARAKAVELPIKCFRVLHPTRKARNRALSGGRGSAKSWSIARVLIVTAIARCVRVLCCREFQKSIDASSHRLLQDQIDLLGLAPWFDVKNTSITSSNGSEFLFEGLHANVSKVKSLEGIDICWVEEAAKVTQNSWDVLIPTIRKAGSEIIANFNPEDEDDPTYKRYSVSPPPDSIVDHVTWIDNPWFPPELEAERLYLLSVDPDAHEHIWGGGCKKQSDAMIFKGKYVVEEFEPQPHWDGPYYGSDFGFSSDPTTLVMCYVADRRLYIYKEAYKVGCDIDRTPELYDEVCGDNRNAVIRADSARPETISYLQRHGYCEVRGVDKWPNSVEEGVRLLRQFEKIVIHSTCKHTQDEARLYSFKVDKLTGDVLTDIVDKHNHIWDAVRYALAPMIKSVPFQGLLEYMKRATGQSAAPAQAGATVPADEPAPAQPTQDDLKAELLAAARAENRKFFPSLPKQQNGGQTSVVHNMFQGWGKK
jgi:phage terminase large subunit